MVRCSVSGCAKEAYHWRISLDCPNSTASNGYLCEVHYNYLLEIIRQVIKMSLRDRVR